MTCRCSSLRWPGDESPDAGDLSVRRPAGAELRRPGGARRRRPFLENVTRGRGIPRERLAEVGQHYFLFGGRSPINDQNRALIAALEADLAAPGSTCRSTGATATGSRTWSTRSGRWPPTAAGGSPASRPAPTRRGRAAASTATNIEDAVAAVPDAPQIDKVRWFAFHPGFVAAVVDRTIEAIEELPPELRDEARLVFVTHSIPTQMNDESGPDGGAYLAQHLDVAAAVAERVTAMTGHARDHELVFCSRSGSPTRRGWSPTSTTGSRSSRPTASGGRADPRGVRLGPHGGGLRPRHRGPGHRGAAGHRGPPGRDRRRRPPLRGRAA